MTLEAQTPYGLRGSARSLAHESRHVEANFVTALDNTGMFVPGLLSTCSQVTRRPVSAKPARTGQRCCKL